jgi:hypothetical protein
LDFDFWRAVDTEMAGSVTARDVAADGETGFAEEGG